jgi:CheY-like chemotaxis protein
MGDTPVGPLRGLHILVVDDNRDMREMLRQLLTHSGALVTIVADARDAVAVLRNVAADVVISDLAMPQRDGQWMIRNLRALGGQPGKVPAIAVTAYRESQTEWDALAAGFDAYLEKPVDFPRLIETIRRLAAGA